MWMGVREPNRRARLHDRSHRDSVTFVVGSARQHQQQPPAKAAQGRFGRSSIAPGEWNRLRRATRVANRVSEMRMTDALKRQAQSSLPRPSFPGRSKRRPATVGPFVGIVSPSVRTHTLRIVPRAGGSCVDSCGVPFFSRMWR